MAASTISTVFSTQITHIGNGTSLAAAAVNPASDSSVALVGSTNLGRYPRADILLSIVPTASVASTSNAIYLYKQDSGENAPGASAKSRLVGVFQVNVTGTTATQTHVLIQENVDISAGDCQFYIENQLNVNIPAGWILKVTPKSEAIA
jgi:hypothetical protein